MEFLPRKYYVYSHSFDGVVFYIGKGIGGRAWDTGDRNAQWHKLVESLTSYEIEIVSWHDTSKEALAAERTEILVRRPSANLQHRTEQRVQLRQERKSADPSSIFKVCVSCRRRFYSRVPRRVWLIGQRLSQGVAEEDLRKRCLNCISKDVRFA